MAVMGDDILSMQRAILAPDGTTRLLHWLGRRVRGQAMMLDPAGRPADPDPAGGPADPDRGRSADSGRSGQGDAGIPADVLAAAEGEIRRVVAGEAAAASVSGPSWWVRVVSAGGEAGGPALLVTSGTPLPPDEGPLIAHAAALLGLRWSADHRTRAVFEIREAVMHLLLDGEVTTARKISAVIKPDLPDLVRIMLVEGVAGDRNAIADRCEAVCGGEAWVIRCPVYHSHVIVIAPAREPRYSPGRLIAVLRAAAVEASGTGGVAIGIGDPVDLRDFGAGYQQAYHALAVARLRPDRLARYTASADLATALGAGARQWARQTLAPLLEHEPARAGDLSSAELRATLRSWLTFRANATAQLNLSQGGLAKRLRRVETILGRSLRSFPEQAELDLALQVLQSPGPRPAGPAPDLVGLLASGPAREWAKSLLAPLDENPVLLETVRAYLAAGESSEAAAAELADVGDRQVRRRLHQAEELLGRSLGGNGPSARYDVFLALRIREGA